MTEGGDIICGFDLKTATNLSFVRFLNLNRTKPEE